MSNNGNILGGGDAFEPRRKPSDNIRPGRGGPRPGSGRKPSVVRKTVEAYRTEGIAVAEAMEILLRIMRDEKTLPKVRVDAANAVLDRLLGRPRQVNENLNVNADGAGLDADARRRLLADPVSREALFVLAERTSALNEMPPDEPTAATG